MMKWHIVPTIERAATVAVTKLIRRRRTASTVSKGTLAPRSATPIPATLREARFSDFTAVAELKQRWGLSPDTLDNWDRLWRHNPAISQLPRERPIGWVLDVQGAVVGYLGNISLIYYYGNRTLRAVTGSSFVVEPAYRSLSVSLLAAFYRQQSVDLFLTTSAIEAVGRMARAFRCSPLPLTDYETVLFWVLRPYRFTYSVMHKLRLRPTLASVAAVISSIVVVADRMIRRRAVSPSSTQYTITERDFYDVGSDFQALWMEKLREEPRMLADRSPDVLRWHFQIPGDTGSACIFSCYSNEELLGYAVLRTDLTKDGLRTSTIADMLAKGDDPVVVRSLFVAAYNHAKHSGSHVFEVLGFPHKMREVCLQWNPYRRRYPACPFYYRATDPAMAALLSNGVAWYACPYDGDANLIRPSYSRPAAPLHTSKTKHQNAI